MAASVRLVGAGYTTVLEGILGPWHFDLVAAETDRLAAPVHYVVLRPDEETCLRRARGRAGEEREPGFPALTDEAPLRHTHRQFRDLVAYEGHAVDTSGVAVDATVAEVGRLVDGGTVRLRLP